MSRNQLSQNYDTSKTFVWGNRFQTESYTNDTYDPITLATGTVMGRVFATGKVVPFASDAVDGSEEPIGVLQEGFVAEGGTTSNVSICVAGDVVQSKLVFGNGTDTLETQITNLGNRRVKDALQGMSVAIKLIASTELSQTDNQ